MTQTEKDLLLQDLCGRLPYGVKFIIDKMYLNEDMIKGGYDKTQELYGITYEGNVELLNMDYHMPVEAIKPHLFPMSSMTEEQKYTCPIGVGELEIFIENANWSIMQITPDSIIPFFDWLHKNHFDYRGLIPKGLANDATGLNIY